MAEHFPGKEEVGSSILPMGSKCVSFGMSFDRTKFFADLYATENSASAIDLVFETIGDLLDGLDMEQFDDIMQEYGGPRITGAKSNNPNFAAVNDILRVANPWKMDSGVGLSFITMTFRNQDKYSEYLPYCQSYCEFLKSIGKEKLAKDIKKRFILP